MSRATNMPLATLGDLRGVTSWLWVICARCLRRTPTALAPWIIRWGAEASSDLLRRSARCAECGGKGATIQIPGWGGLQAPVRGWPGEDRVGSRPNSMALSSAIRIVAIVDPWPHPQHARKNDQRAANNHRGQHGHTLRGNNALDGKSCH